MTDCETALVRRHVATCCGWARAVRKFNQGTVAMLVAIKLDGHIQLAMFAELQPRVAAAVRAKGVG